MHAEYNASKTKEIIYNVSREVFDMGWIITFRIHNASSRIELFIRQGRSA